MSDVQERIKQTVESDDVVLFMKGSPDFPHDIRQGIKQFSNWPTIPQLYIKGEFIGGSDIILEMYEKGELQQKLAG